MVLLYHMVSVESRGEHEKNCGRLPLGVNQKKDPRISTQVSIFYISER